jgi:tetratricopeptide (TPR) repeat protein
MVVPRKDKASISAQGPSGGLLPGYNSSNDFTVPMHLDSTLSLADLAVSTLRDSMSLMNNEMRNMMIRLASVEQKKLFLNDSLKAITLKQNVAENNMNEAMRHLSKSLRYFYAGDYREALKEVDLALELNPNMALAYARRGSIYYKLGDVQRATINWNLALRLDPEYDDVRNILKALHEDRLKSTSIFEEE